MRVACADARVMQGTWECAQIGSTGFRSRGVLGMDLNSVRRTAVHESAFSDPRPRRDQHPDVRSVSKIRSRVVHKPALTSRGRLPSRHGLVQGLGPRSLHQLGDYMHNLTTCPLRCSRVSVPVSQSLGRRIGCKRPRGGSVMDGMVVRVLATLAPVPHSS